MALSSFISLNPDRHICLRPPWLIAPFPHMNRVIHSEWSKGWPRLMFAGHRTPSCKLQESSDIADRILRLLQSVMIIYHGPALAKIDRSSPFWSGSHSSLKSLLGLFPLFLLTLLSQYWGGHFVNSFPDIIKASKNSKRLCRVCKQSDISWPQQIMLRKKPRVVHPLSSVELI